MLACGLACVTSSRRPVVTSPSGAPAAADSSASAPEVAAEKRPDKTAVQLTKATRSRWRARTRAFYRGYNCRLGPPGLLPSSNAEPEADLLYQTSPADMDTDANDGYGPTSAAQSLVIGESCRLVVAPPGLPLRKFEGPELLDRADGDFSEEENEDGDLRSLERAARCDWTYGVSSKT